MRALIACLAGILFAGGCHGALSRVVPASDPAHTSGRDAPPVPRDAAPSPLPPFIGTGAAPGSVRGPGGFVPRGSAKNFYTAGGGRLWYYMNNYYWASPTAPEEDLWIKAEVVEQWRNLTKWPDGAAVASPAPKVTVEYWEVGPNRRSIRLDSHKDFCLLSDEYTAGAITVEVTLTLGRLEVREAEGPWERPREAYVLESRNYSEGGGIGSERARFQAVPTEAVTVWGYRVPWSTHPQRVTRSNWRRLESPAWGLMERRLPPGTPVPLSTLGPHVGPVVTPRGADAKEP